MLQWHYNVHLYYFCTFLSNYDGSIQHGEGKKRKKKENNNKKKSTLMMTLTATDMQIKTCSVIQI